MRVDACTCPAAALSCCCPLQRLLSAAVLLLWSCSCSLLMLLLPVTGAAHLLLSRSAPELGHGGHVAGHDAKVAADRRHQH
jgi:hypothetical protein